MMHMKLTHNCISGMVGRYGRVVGCYVVMILPGNLRTTLPLTNPILVAYALADLHLLVNAVLTLTASYVVTKGLLKR